MSLYETISHAAELHRAISDTYPDAADNDDSGIENDPRWDEWHRLMDEAESVLPPNVDEGVLCHFEPGMTEAQLIELLRRKSFWAA